MWSEPLKLILPNGKMVCVLLVDCQGCFDDKTNLRGSKYQIERERLAQMHELAVAECLSTLN